MGRTIHGKRTKGGSTAKLTNNCCIFGIMGGTAPLTGKPLAHRAYLEKRASRKALCITDCAQGHQYLKDNQILGCNPQAGGVGNMWRNRHYSHRFGPTPAGDGSAHGSRGIGAIQTKTPKLNLYVQADNTVDDLSNTLLHLKNYRKASDNNKGYFDILTLFAANIDYGQSQECNSSNEQDKPCWQKNDGCQRLGQTLSFNSTLTKFFCDNKSIDILKTLKNLGTKIYISILGNHKGGGIGGFTNLGEAEYFVNSIKNVFQYYNIENLIDGISFDDEFTEYDKRTISPPATSYQFLTLALINILKYKYNIAYSYSPANDSKADDVNWISQYTNYIVSTNYFGGVSNIYDLINFSYPELTNPVSKFMLGIQMIDNIDYKELNNNMSKLKEDNVYGVALFSYKLEQDLGDTFLSNPKSIKFLKKYFGSYKLL